MLHFDLPEQILAHLRLLRLQHLPLEHLFVLFLIDFILGHAAAGPRWSSRARALDETVVMFALHRRLMLLVAHLML